MNVLGVPWEEAEIESIQAKYPDFDGIVPPEARFWGESDLEAFFASNGLYKPRETADTGKPLTCPLLSRLRLHLADLRIDEATKEYISYCRHIQERRNPCKLPDLARCGPVRRVRECPENPQVPVTVTRAKDIPELSWGIAFWQQQLWDRTVVARARSPAFESDRGIDAFAVETSVWDYVEYIKLIENADGGCLEDNALCYPRVQVDGWSPFGSGPGRKILEENWRTMTPAGVEDLNARWVELMVTDGDLASVVDSDMIAVLSRFYEVSLCASGCIGRLRAENHGAHAWFTQIEGQKIFFVFPPTDAAKFYEERGGYIVTPDGYTTTASAVDVFFPNAKRHPNFLEVNSQVAYLRPGDTLVIPAGWWYTSIATEPSVTLKHRYWGMDNRLRIIDDLWAIYDRDDISPEVRDDHRDRFRSLREVIKSDDGITPI